jgi:replicative DNA helicase
MNATQYLGKLAANATTVVNASSYGRIIKDVSTQRRLLLITEDLQEAARQPTAEFSPSQQIAEHLQRLTTLDGRPLPVVPFVGETDRDFRHAGYSVSPISGRKCSSRANSGSRLGSPRAS